MPLLNLKSVKLRRAQQLGKIWPRREWVKLMDDAAPVKVLFVCSRNQWHSPTGEKVWARVSSVSARSAGHNHNARRRLTVADIRWADLILVMEEKHKSRIRADFRDETRFKPLHVLDIPDDYRFMDPELVEIIREKSEALIYGETD
ncbi:MAG: low molecular weight protein tyrosine phosphatase family protein [Aestuariivirgaceae bacterium]